MEISDVNKAEKHELLEKIESTLGLCETSNFLNNNHFLLIDL